MNTRKTGNGGNNRKPRPPFGAWVRAQTSLNGRDDWGRGVPAAASPPTGSPLQYSPALRRVTTGFGMGPGGATALSATGTPRPPTSPRWSSCSPHGTPAARGRSVRFWLPGCLTKPPPPLPGCAGGLCGSFPAGTWSGHPAWGTEPVLRTAWQSLPSIIRTRQLRSLARRPPRAYQPGRLPGILPALAVGYVVLGKDSRLDAFSGSPVRTWLLSAARCQTTDPPAVRPTRSSRTRVSVPHVSNAHGG